MPIKNLCLHVSKLMLIGFLSVRIGFFAILMIKKLTIRSMEDLSIFPVKEVVPTENDLTDKLQDT